MSIDYEKQTRDLKDSLCIEKVIGAYVHLQQKFGGKYIGLCPFHDDSHPSMYTRGSRSLNALPAMPGAMCFRSFSNTNVAALRMR